MKRLEKNQLYHCRLQGAEQTGHLSISDDGMSVKLFDYDNFFHIERDTVLHLRLEDSRSVSLHDTVAGGTGQHTKFGDNTVSTYAAKIHANTVVVGDRSWEYADAIRLVSFRIKWTKPLLENAKKVRSLALRSRRLLAEESNLFEVRSRDLTVRCWYAGSGSFNLGLNEWWPQFEVEFDKSRTLQSYLGDVNRVLKFFSAAAGSALMPSEISISSFNQQENNDRLEKGLNVHFFDVEYVWPDVIVRDFDLHPLHSFVCAFDAKEIRTMGVCLTAWLDRSPKWEEASTLMMGSLGMHNQISGERLLMACRWFEKIPGVTAERNLAVDDLCAITSAAVEAANSRNMKVGTARIYGALQNLGSESNRDRFSRLVTSVVKRFPNCGLDDTTIKHLMDAQKLRGRVAHGLLEPQAEGLIGLQRAITSTEALSYLLMIKDLPMTSKGRNRATSSRLVSDYGYAKIAPDM